MFYFSAQVGISAISIGSLLPYFLHSHIELELANRVDIVFCPARHTQFARNFKERHHLDWQSDCPNALSFRSVESLSRTSLNNASSACFANDLPGI